MKSDEFKNISVQIEPELLEKIDGRSAELDLNRSQYLRRLIRRDLGISQLELNASPRHELEEVHA